MSISFFIVLNDAGIPIYSKSAETNFKIDMVLFGGFFSAIQSFAEQLSEENTYIQQMTIGEYIYLYRNIQDYLFIGKIENRVNIKLSQIVFEYFILIFISNFRQQLKDNDCELSQFLKFDGIFLKHYCSKEKELKKGLQREFTNSNILEGILNQLVNYFPINDLVKLNEECLKIIGKKLISVRFDIDPVEEQKLIAILKEKTLLIYGPDTFETILENVQKRII